MSFGFGIGDIIACSEVAWKTINALKSAGSDFEGLRLDLASLTSVLQALEAEAKGPMPLIKTASMERQNQMRLLLHNCTESMKELQGVVGKYSGWGADKKKDFVAWMKFAAKDKRGPREKLAIHTASINIFLTTLSHGSLARLEFLIKNGSQAAHQGPVPDGSKGLDFSATGAPWSGSHAHSKRKDVVVWQEIGRSLQGEGIADEDIEAFQEEIKAYARYLVRGETPFWREPVSKSRSHEVHQVVELTPSALRSSNSLRYEEEVKRLVLRDEIKQARQTQRLDAAVLTDLDSEMRKAKIREEEYMRRRKEESMEKEHRQEEVEKKSKASEEEDVVSLAYKFESLFDFEAELTQAAPEAPDYQTETAQSTSATDDDGRKYGQERRDARVYEIQRRIGKLVDRRERYIEEGRRDKMADLEVNDIPDQVKLLQLEGVAVSHARAWKWDHWCDVCNFRIPGDRYHCTQCRGGNWDACQECWDKGARCSGRGQHKITLTGRSVA
ncbi:hypothetical protein INS49_012526 [Diaporthe citri]|uniref:uncharacterized protein n=1 Tax=Diaporthe citri TaxID=83186 RepID=UPI001C7E6AA4|nr:uncharacterized protein INS49_012526 [Diaporthe citri]KAG6359006.1 hypothetical protein INS49_012526 [Diaporthe citri]